MPERERERERDRRVEEHPVTHQSPLFWFYLFHRFFVFFPFTCLHKLFPLQPSLLFNLCIAQCERMSLLWKLERGDDEASKLQISLYVFRLSKLLLSLFIYCTNNSTVYASNSSVKCVFTMAGSLFSSASVLLPPLFPCV